MKSNFKRNSVRRFGQSRQNLFYGVLNALQNIYKHPEKYVLFELCLEEEHDETLKDIKEMIVEFEKVIENK